MITVAQSPGDLFFGSHDVEVEFGSTEMGRSHEVQIFRKTASVIITARKFPAGESLSDYSFILRESPDTYDSNGELSGNMVNYKPAISAVGDNKLATSLFNTFPTAGNEVLRARNIQKRQFTVLFHPRFRRQRIYSRGRKNTEYRHRLLGGSQYKSGSHSVGCDLSGCRILIKTIKYDETNLQDIFLIVGRASLEHGMQ